ncbi:MAG: O-acetylhomoserine aminocarboxypropyltransferase/cysteine synthase family protein [Campylobacterales bacterium]
MQDRTKAVHSGNVKNTGYTVATPIYQTTAFEFDSAEHGANLFALKELGNIYTRLSNPTTDIFEKKVAELEGGVIALGASSGQAAIFYSIVNVAEVGDNIVVSNKLYGGTSNLFHYTLKRFGIEARVYENDNPEEIEGLIDEKTKAIYFESLSNPQISISDIEAITTIAKKHRIVTICDNTVATPILCKPIEYGVDVVVHSASKYIGGQGTALGGVVVERDGMSEFFKDNPRYSHFYTPDYSYHGLIYTECGLPPFCIRLRLSLLRDIGAAPSPFNSWLFISGLETLSIRMKSVSSSALEVAKFLEEHAKVKSVRYPGLESYYRSELAQKYLVDTQGSGLVSFELGSYEDAKKVMDRIEIFKTAVNIGDSKSIITHPASMTHQQLSSEQLKSAGIGEGQIRLSIGLEDSRDLVDDLSKALS